MATTTTRLGLDKPAYADAADIAVLNQNFDDIDAAVGLKVVTSTTRPATPWDGQLIFETDTNQTLMWDSTASAWKYVGGAAIVCTSSTRPASPLNGQIIYETDTRNVLVYSTAATAWRFPVSYYRPANAAGLSALTGMVSGAHAYQQDTNVEYVYNGAAWKQVYPLPAGTVLQVVSATRTTSASSGSATSAFVDITGMTVTITPRSTTSKILVSFNVYVGNSTTTGTQNYVQIVRGTTAIGVGTGGSSINSSGQTWIADDGRLEPVANSFLDSPSTTSATTYKLQYRTSAGTIYLNRRGSANDFNTASTITVTEIAG